jgi:hypothetical protein
MSCAPIIHIENQTVKTCTLEAIAYYSNPPSFQVIDCACSIGTVLSPNPYREKAGSARKMTATQNASLNNGEVMWFQHVKTTTNHPQNHHKLVV